MVRTVSLRTAPGASGWLNANAALALDRAATLAAEVLSAGEVVLIPTDTVYGLAVAASRKGGVEALARIKRRDPEKPVAVLVASAAEGMALFDRPGEPLRRLGSTLWPGPLTLVAPAAAGAPPAMVTSSGTIGVRCPANDLVQRVVRTTGPLAVSSANRAGAEPLCHVADLSELVDRWPELAEASLVVDSGRLPGTASTVVEAPSMADGGGSRSPRILRIGPIDEATVLGVWSGASSGSPSGSP